MIIEAIVIIIVACSSWLIGLVMGAWVQWKKGTECITTLDKNGKVIKQWARGTVNTYYHCHEKNETCHMQWNWWDEDNRCLKN